MLFNPFKKWHFKKNPLNDRISKTRTNSELKLRFSEGSFNFFQNNVIFRAPYNPRRRYQPLAGLIGLVMSQEKIWICPFLSIMKMSRNLKKKLHFFTFGQTQCLYLTYSTFSTGILSKIVVKKNNFNPICPPAHCALPVGFLTAVF